MAHVPSQASQGDLELQDQVARSHPLICGLYLQGAKGFTCREGMGLREQNAEHCCRGVRDRPEFPYNLGVPWIL